MAVAGALVGRALSLLAVTHVMAARRKRGARLFFAKTDYRWRAAALGGRM
jgi:hypothetical protein